MPYRTFSIVKLLSFIFSMVVFSYPAFAKLPQENTLIITNSNAWKPFSYLENGEPKGLLIDFWRLYGERSGQKIVFNLVDWQESLNIVAGGDTQIHAGLVYSKKRAELFEFGGELLNVQTSIYIDKNMIAIVESDLSDMQQLVGVVSGSDEQRYMTTHYPDMNLIPYANNQLMFEAVQDQKISIFIADKQVANFYMVSYLHRANDFITLVQLYDKPIRFAVKKGNMVLLRLIEEQLKSVSKGDVDQIKQKWINTETKVPVWFYNSLFFCLLFATVAYIYSLRKAVEKRTLQLAIANEKLIKQVNSDVLTGLYNRRFLMDYLREMQSKNYYDGCAVLMIDIDFFKPINDTYGHPVGDIALTILAKRVKSCIREKDILARLGGEEFCVVLQGVSSDKMKDISAKINHNVAVNPFRSGDDKFKITVSIGALHIPSYQKWSSEQLFKQVDKLLYQAKNNGRDQTVCGKFIRCASLSVTSF